MNKADCSGDDIKERRCQLKINLEFTIMIYSVIFLVEDESPDFCQFFDMICRLFKQKEKEFEIIIVANATENFVKSQLISLENHSEEVKMISFQQKVSQSLCMKVALGECGGEKILTLGPFQELTAESYEKLVNSIPEGVDIVVPYRKLRKDPIINRLHSKFINKAVKMLLGVKLNDIGCNVKFMRREVLEAVELYGNMYRYFPVLAMQKGFKIKEIECDQVDKIRKTRFYGLRLYLDRLIEILNLFFSTNFSKKPLRFFNLVGSGFMVFGVMALFYAGMQKVISDIPIGDRPLLIVAIISLVAGAQLASFGLLGEIISFVYGRSRKEYTIEKVI